MKSNRKMGSNGSKMRYTGKGWTDIRDKKFTAPTPGLKNVFFSRGNDFKRVLSALSAYLGELDLSKLWKIDIDSPVWDKWQRPDCSHLDTVCNENMDSRTHFMYLRKVREHNDKANKWGENHAAVHLLLFQHCDTEMKTMLKADPHWNLNDKNECVTQIATIKKVTKDLWRDHKK